MEIKTTLWGLEHMEIKNRLFPYPVLCVENDDYENCEFNVITKVHEELNDIVIDFDIQLVGIPEMQWLIRDNNAQYVIHIECSSTAYRTIIKTAETKKTVRIPKSRVNIEISLLATVVAEKDIINFNSNNLNEDYDESISFRRGSILAYKNLPKIYVTKNYEELAGDNSFFTVVKRIDGDGIQNLPVTYSLADSKIKILVSEKIYDEYIKYHKNPTMEPLMNTLLVMPAIAHMIDEIRANTAEEYKQYYWYQKINKACKLQGKDFVEDIINSEASCMDVAQEMLQLPIERAFECLSRVIEE